MERNFFRRIEVCFPVTGRHRDQILEDLQVYLSDNVQAWELRADGSYDRCCRRQTHASMRSRLCCAATAIRPA